MYFLIKTLNYIRVKPRTTYYIYVYCYQEVKFTSVKIGMYNSDKEFIANASTNLGNSIITFEAVSNCKYVTLEVGVEEEWGAGMDIHIVENNYYMSDVQVNINGMSEEDLKYKGPSYDYSPVISGYDGYYITDVDDPISLNELLSKILISLPIGSVSGKSLAASFSEITTLFLAARRFS